MPKNDDKDGRSLAKNGGKNQNGNGKQISSEECDFVDEKELQGAVQLAVLRTADSVAQEVGARNGMDMEIEEEVVNRVAALIWDTVADSWTDDLGRFAAHAGRQRVHVEDVSLLTRRNPELFEATCSLAGINPSENGQKKAPKGTRKRKKDDNPTFLQTPKADAKKPKNFTTSTPKAHEKSIVQPIFGGIGIPEITPIRPNFNVENEEDDDIIIEDFVMSNEKVKKTEELSVIQEENDSFEDATRAPHFSITNPNMTSLLKQAENHRGEESERLEALIPEEEQFEEQVSNSIDDFFGTETAPKTPKIPEKSTENTPKIGEKSGRKSNISMDPFLSTIMAETSTKLEEKMEKSEKSSGAFNKKLSAFEFDSDDSFDNPGPSTKKPEKVKEIEKSTPVSTKNATKNSSQSTPKSTSKRTNKSEKSNKSLAPTGYDSFDEFDFDI